VSRVSSRHDLRLLLAAALPAVLTEAVCPADVSHVSVSLIGNDDSVT
jgi:hypothetical protein